MTRLKVLAVAFAGLLSAHTAEAQTTPEAGATAPSSLIRFKAEEPIQVRQKGFSFPVIEYTDERGVRQQRKGIIASQRIAPGTLLGIGFYETAPKSRGLVGEPPSNIAPRRTKRAAVGLSWQF
jgi:hypothetical protein